MDIPKTGIKEGIYDLSRSPVFTPSDIEQLSKQDKKAGVPLQTPWTFWLDKSSHVASAAQYQANLKNIYTVGTVQEFWAVFNNIPPVETLPPRCSYHLMRESIQPMWEDEKNKQGGTWRWKVLKKDTPKVWQEFLLAAIGEQLSEAVVDGDSVCGITITRRDKDDLVQVWNLNAKLAENLKMLPLIHGLVPDVDFKAVYYKPHYDHAAFESR